MSANAHDRERAGVRWTPFLDHPEFRHLYDRDEKGPVAEQIDMLLRDITDVKITDPILLATKKGQLWGLLAVREAVVSLAQHEQQEHADSIAAGEARGGGEFRPAEWPFPRVM